jgi:hypothetical protein
LPHEVRPQARRELALHAKRRGEHARAAELWHEIVAGDPAEGVHACEQLAIHYERRVKDDVRALEFAQLALTELRKARWLSSRTPAGHYAGAFPGSSNPRASAAKESRQEKSLLRRIARLEHRRTRSSAPPRPLLDLA